MDHPYSFWADLLSKFQGATPWIQALWLVLAAGVMVCAVWAAADIFKCTATGVRRRRAKARLVYGLVQDEQGQWLVCIEGEATRVEGAAASGAGSIAAAREDPFATPILPPRT
jgi:hypothetical protein